MNPRFQIGQQYKTQGKAPKLCTIVDIYRVYNHEGGLVKIRYMATHQFMGQMVTDHDVCETTIARGLVGPKGWDFVTA